MKHTKTLTIGGLPLMWALYFAFELITGRADNFLAIIGNFILILLFLITGYIIYKLYIKYSNGINKKSFFSLILIFLALDQVVKLIINFYFFKRVFDIIPGILSFHPIINSDGSWLNARFGASVSFPALIITNLIFVFLIIEVYRYFSSKSKISFLYDMTFIFLFCGALCSLIDKIFYGGSLDFIGISNLFIADIKDLYINLGLYFFMLGAYDSGYLTSKDNTSFNEDIKAIKVFFNFIKNDIRCFFKK